MYKVYPTNTFCAKCSRIKFMCKETPSDPHKIPLLGAFYHFVSGFCPKIDKGLKSRFLLYFQLK